MLGFGANDDKAYMTGLPAGVSIDEFGSASWEREYRRRVGGLMELVTRAGAHLVWVGLPITRSPEQTRRFDVINAAVVAEVRRRPRAVSYVDTYSIFAAETAGTPTTAPRPPVARSGCGPRTACTSTPRAARVIAREVLKRLNAAYDLTSWRSRRG